MDEKLQKEYDEYQKQGRIWGGIDKERIRKIKYPRVDKSIIDQFLKLDDLTSTISDILDSMGICGAIPASFMSPILPDRKMVGPAITLRSVPGEKDHDPGI